MTFADIDNALKARLNAIRAGIAVAWPGLSFQPGAEFIEFQHSPVTRTDTTLTGDYSTQEGIVLMNAVVRSNIGEKRALEIADLIRGGFRMGLRLAAGSANVVIEKPAEPRPGFTDGTYYRIPVVVNYTTERN